MLNSNLPISLVVLDALVEHLHHLLVFAMVIIYVTHHLQPVSEHYRVLLTPREQKELPYDKHSTRSPTMIETAHLYLLLLNQMIHYLMGMI